MGTGAGMVVVLAAAVLAGLGAAVVHRRVGLDLRRRHHDAGSAIFLQLGVIYAVLLAFVFSETWSQYTLAAQAINAECSGLHASVLLAHGLDERAGERFDRSVEAYLRTVVGTEWPLMARHESSPDALRLVATMFDEASRIEGDSTRVSLVRTGIMAQLATAHAQRETRLFQMDQGIPPLLWALLLAFSAVLAGFVMLSGVEFAASLGLFAALFSAWIAATLVMIRMLDYPFEGALALEPRDFVRTLARVSALLAG